MREDKGENDDVIISMLKAMAYGNRQNIIISSPNCFSLRYTVSVNMNECDSANGLI